MRPDLPEAIFEKGEKVVVPKGTRISGTGAFPSHTPPDSNSWESKRAQTVPSFDRVYREGQELTWTGAGGYWRRTRITDELLRANGKQA